MEFTTEKLAELQAAALRPAQFSDIFADTSTDDARAQLEPYLKQFLPPGPCVCCKQQLGGLFGSFTWGLAHGEGFCGGCRYPARAFHRFEPGSPVLSFSFVLQYHPSELVDRTQAAEGA